MTWWRCIWHSPSAAPTCPQSCSKTDWSQAETRQHIVNDTGCPPLSVQQRADFKLCVLVFICLHNLAPSYLSRMCQQVVDIKTSPPTFKLSCTLWPHRSTLLLQVRRRGTLCQLHFATASSLLCHSVTSLRLNCSPEHNTLLSTLVTIIL